MGAPIEAEMEDDEVSSYLRSTQGATPADIRAATGIAGITLEKQLESGTPYVIRFRFEPNKDIVLEDMVRGEVVVNTATLDDKILPSSIRMSPVGSRPMS